MATLISIGIPCAALQAMIIGLVGGEGWQYVAITGLWQVFGFVFDEHYYHSLKSYLAT